MRGKAPTYPVVKNPSTRLFWEDLHKDAGLKMCSLAAQGLWTHHMLAICAGSFGYLAIDGRPMSVSDLAAFIGKPLGQVRSAFAELAKHDVFSVDRFGTPYNRRMVKGQKRAETNRKNGQNGGRPKTLERKDNFGLQTQTKPKANPNHNPNADLRARGLQDFKTPSKKESISVAEQPCAIEAEPVLFAEVPIADQIAPTNWQHINGRSSAETVNALFSQVFWPAYPETKGNKEPARKAFAKALKQDNAQSIMRGLDHYFDKREAQPAGGEQYTKRASTWLNQMGWQDENREFDREMGIEGDG